MKQQILQHLVQARELAEKLNESQLVYFISIAIEEARASAHGSNKDK